MHGKEGRARPGATRPAHLARRSGTQPAMDPAPPGRGVRAAQRPCRPPPGVGGRAHRGVAAGHAAPSPRAPASSGRTTAVPAMWRSRYSRSFGRISRRSTPGVLSRLPLPSASALAPGPVQLRCPPVRFAVDARQAAPIRHKLAVAFVTSPGSLTPVQETPALLLALLLPQCLQPQISRCKPHPFDRLVRTRLPNASSGHSAESAWTT